MPAILNEKALAGLRSHKYSASAASPLDRFIMTHWWNFLVEFCPLWLAPNLITLIGLMVTVTANLHLLYHAPLMDTEAPRYAYLLCAIGVFFYQSLDAIDGKQARRTKSSSPLGELFDHGCDSLTTTFLTLAAGVAFLFGPNYISVVACVAYCIGFYAAHWITFITGTLQFGYIDVTEGQLIIIVIYMVCYVYGPDVFLEEYYGYQLRTILTVAALGGVVSVVGRLTLTILSDKKTTVAGTSKWEPLFPLVVMIALSFLPAMFSPTEIVSHQPVIYVLAVGFCFSKICIRLVTASMSKSPMPQLDSILLGPIVVLLNGLAFTYCADVIPDSVSQYLATTKEEETRLMAIFLAYSALNLLGHCVLLCHEIAAAMNISVLTIPYPPPKDS